MSSVVAVAILLIQKSLPVVEKPCMCLTALLPFLYWGCGLLKIIAIQWKSVSVCCQAFL